MISKKCLVCGKDFLSYPTQNKKLCSIKCAFINRKGKKAWNKGKRFCIIKQCLLCKKKFEMRDKRPDRGKYCSVKCSVQFYWSKQEKKRIAQTCFNCQKIFHIEPSKLKHQGKHCSLDCYRQAQKSHKYMDDITGQKFGRLTAIRFIKSKGYSKYWLFKCDCGKEKVIIAGGVRFRAVNSCGCYSTEYRQSLVGEKNPSWKGDEVGYHGLHDWVRKKLGQPDTCESCGKSGLKGLRIHWHNIDHKYKRNLTDWKRLCAACHSKEKCKMKYL